MQYNMVGVNPIEFYYPNGYGELKIQEQSVDSSASFAPTTQQRRMTWVTPQLLNRSYNETSPARPIYEGQKILREGSTEYGSYGCETTLQIRASYQSYRNQPSTTGGDIKYAIIDGVLPPSLTFDIDTGRLFGVIDDLDTIYADLSNTPVPGDREEDAEAAATYNYNFGDQEPKKYDERNYGQAGSAALHADGLPVPKGVTFIARAFNVEDPTNDYIDGRFTIDISNNWSSDRDAFILNIRNQFFVDGKPVTNKEYLSVMKSRGYFPSCS